MTTADRQSRHFSTSWALVPPISRRISSSRLLSRVINTSGNQKITFPGEAFQILFSGSSIYLDNMSFTIKDNTTIPKELNLTFSLFIPPDYVTGGPTEKCSNRDFVRQLYYKGDNRTFALNGSSSRGRQTFSVIPDVAGDADGLKNGSLRTVVGETRAYASDAVVDGKIDPRDNDSTLNDCVLLHQRKTAPSDKMIVRSERVTDKIIRVYIYGSLGNPLSLIKIPADWYFKLTLDASAVPTKWTLEGSRDTFPAYELYIGSQLIYKYSPGKPPFAWTRIAQGLGGNQKPFTTRSGIVGGGS